MEIRVDYNLSKKSLRNPLLLSAFALLFLCVLPPDSSAQYCIGYTEYRIRRPNGKLLTNKRFKKLEFVSLDGQERDVTEKDGRTGIYYEIDGRNRSHNIKRRNYIAVVFLPCGQIDELTLRYDGLEMKLIFNIGINNTNFLINSLPLRSGTFRLSSLEYSDLEQPPRIDNENWGVCSVPETHWEKILPEPSGSKGQDTH